MKISRSEQMMIDYRANQLRLQHQREKDYCAIVDRRKFERIVEERISRARRLGLDKGQNIDIEC